MPQLENDRVQSPSSRSPQGVGPPAMASSRRRPTMTCDDRRCGDWKVGPGEPRSGLAEAVRWCGEWGSGQSRCSSRDADYSDHEAPRFALRPRNLPQFVISARHCGETSRAVTEVRTPGIAEGEPASGATRTHRTRPRINPATAAGTRSPARRRDVRPCCDPPASRSGCRTGCTPDRSHPRCR